MVKQVQEDMRRNQAEMLAAIARLSLGEGCAGGTAKAMAVS
jgi:hypothetical protein